MFKKKKAIGIGSKRKRLLLSCVFCFVVLPPLVFCGSKGKGHWDSFSAFNINMAVSFVQKRFMASALQKWAYNISGFNKYGLMRDDLLHENDVVAQALKRLPQKIVDERNYRLLRALQLSIQKDVLPKEQWTKIENDKLYLTPVVEEIIKEQQEQEEWNKNY